MAQMVRTVPSSSGAPATSPVYQAIGNAPNGQVQYVRLVTNQGEFPVENGILIGKN